MGERFGGCLSFFLFLGRVWCIVLRYGGVPGIYLGLALIREAFDERSRFGRVSWYQFDRELTCLAGFAFFRFVSFYV